jgi:hypothetical protein
VREEDFVRAIGEIPSEKAGKSGEKTILPAIEKVLPAFFPAVICGNQMK